MEVFMWNVDFHATRADVVTEIAKVLHRDDYLELWQPFRVNLDVQLHTKNKRVGTIHSGSGRFTVASERVARRFLEEYEGLLPLKTLRFSQRQVSFGKSKHAPNKGIIEKLKRTPYVDPREEAEKQRRMEEAEANRIPIRGIEFGWECRDLVFSCEWEKSLDPESGLLGYDEDRREFRVVFGSKSIALRLAQINGRRVSCGMDGSLPVIFFSLESAPIFEEVITTPQPDSSPLKRTRVSALDASHERVVAYASLAVRLICDSRSSLGAFRTLCGVIPSVKLSDDIYHKEYRQLFSAELAAQFERWLAQLDFEVAFQLEKTVRDMLVDFREVLATREAVEDLVRSEGPKHTVGVLRLFHSALKESTWDIHSKDIPDLFLTAAREYVPEPSGPENPIPEDTFSCYHVSVTPTAMKFSGPFQEKSNRVFRKYPNRHSCFIRMTFEEETRLKFRFDREVDGATFVKKRYGTILRETGLKICGREYFFLAYSQSALKEHSVWFMRPFKDEGVLVHPPSIIESLGNFDNTSDRNLIYCPGRYGARISQAFTSTDPGVTIEPEEIRELPDIEVLKVPGDPSRGRHNFTDGVGTISYELAEEIHRAMIRMSRKARWLPTDLATVLQIRFQGCKGMVSVDYLQSGRELALRPSMIKFQAPEWSEIEIVRAFDRPSPFYLNRPLIMVLEGLGVKYQVFKDHQDAAVRQAQNSRQDLKSAGELFESCGLGASFRLPSIMYHLHKLKVPMQKDPFFKHLMDFAINHALRELKHHARIPINPGHTLVGVADIHGWLKPDEVFACIVNQQTKRLEYLEGEMVITRSPVIHPGDVQLVRAIGRPPPGSPFEKERLPNAVVFSIKGDRPVPSKLGGGDLDGDLYNIAPRRQLPIEKTHSPAAYPDAPKRLLDRKCTMDDVADFVTDYVNSDVLGLISSNWLIIADQSSVFDEDCETLAQLHSFAVDYPKSSTPVPLEKIPKTKFKARPDWSQPETMNDSKSADFYESTTAVGRLFRAIQLPALDIVRSVNRAQRRKLRAEEGGEEGDRLLAELERMSLRNDDKVDAAVFERITQFIDGDDVDPDYRDRAFTIFDRYTAELKIICAAYTISYSRDAMLTEEEAAVGTIVARTSQPRFRLNMMSKLREQTDLQVKGVRGEVASKDDEFETKLEKAWALWRVTQEERELMGARTLGLIALGVIFDTIKEYEEEQRGY
ncbi:RNA dependent RNA polymerase-domain-containing protein [Thelephora terrestris]|uniref:RNA-dependent RNA polymerase n=1 Tax=Thelephora terrestris TaxID=56493 RepID=A0A9P6LC23_9AGAM|nr:RNA dependent RNA polymerase-domain-containing protein [Thelephora terrestris]